MKIRLFSLLTAVVFLLCWFTACGKAPAPESPTGESQTEEPFGADRTRAPDGAGETTGSPPAEETQTQQAEMQPEPDGSFSDDARAALEDLRREMAANACVCAVRVVGAVDISGGPVREDPAYLDRYLRESAAVQAWPFLAEIPPERIVETHLGQTMFAVVPASDGCSVSVNAWNCSEENGFEGETGDVLFRSEQGGPILLICNYSDLFPDAQVIVVGDGGVADFKPMLSGMDGSVVLPAGAPVLDFTPVEE